MSRNHEDAARGSQDDRRHKLDHQTRNQWLDRDAGLRKAWHESNMTRDEFIRRHEELIDKVILNSGG